MSRKGCELCSNPARMFCDSDQASLCWDCDEKVHAANFLVAKHSRTLLCHVCFSPTPWKAAGPRLGPTVSVCHACARCGHDEDAQNTSESEGDGDREYYSSETDDSTQEADDEDEDEDEDEEGENQVVPWSDSASDSAPAASSSGEEEEEERFSLSSSKRSHDDAFAADEVNSFDGCSSSRNEEMGSEEFDETNCDSLRFERRIARGSGGGPSSGTAAIVEKLRRFEQLIVAEESDASAMIAGICNLTRE